MGRVSFVTRDFYKKSVRRILIVCLSLQQRLDEFLRFREWHDYINVSDASVCFYKEIWEHDDIILDLCNKIILAFKFLHRSRFVISLIVHALIFINTYYWEYL